MSVDIKTIADTSPAAASTVAGSRIAGLSEYQQIQIVAELVGATGGTLDVYLQTSFDNTNWFDIVHFTQLAGGAAAVKYSTTLRNPAAAAITTIGKNTTPALAAGSVVQGAWGSQIRALYVAGAATSAGAAVAITFACFRQKQ